MLRKISAYFDDNGISYKIQVLPDKDVSYEKMAIIEKDYVDYLSVLGYIEKSKCILDICQDGQTGMTLRAVEAMFYDKKIITNNKKYKYLPFYQSNQIYIIEDDNFSGMKEFLDGKDTRYAVDDKDYYNVESWIKRFV